jgi:hypothetical protein
MGIDYPCNIIATPLGDVPRQYMRISQMSTLIDMVFSNVLYKETCVQMLQMYATLYSRDDHIRHIWALNKIPNTFSP